MVSVVICTCSRGESVLMPVRSLLADPSSRLEVIVVDQSADNATGEALHAHLADPRLRYIHTATPGKTRAMNLGLREARGTIVAFTDDDCVTGRGFPFELADVLASRPRAAVAFCTVAAAPHDPALGFVPAYRCVEGRTLRSPGDLARGRGLEGGMAVRKPLLLEMGGFDETLGPGAEMPAAEGPDVALRALLRGYEILETERASVVHHGFYSWERGRQVGKRDFEGIGAFCAKALRCGGWRCAGMVLGEVWANLVRPPLSNLVRLQHPRGMRRPIYFAQGFARAWKMHSPEARGLRSRSTHS
jgi:GT2 family glycosyltransferase